MPYVSKALMYYVYKYKYYKITYNNKGISFNYSLTYYIKGYKFKL